MLRIPEERRRTVRRFAHIALAGVLLGWATPSRAGWNPNGEPVPARDPCGGLFALAHAGGEGVFLLWAEYSSTTFAHELRVHHRLADGLVAPGWPATGKVLATLPWGIAFCEAAEDGAGGAYVAHWLANVNAGDSVRAIVFRHMLPQGVLDPGWPPEGLALANKTLAGTGVLARHPDGGVVLAWLEILRVEYEPFFGLRFLADLRATRVTAEGTVASGWPAEGLRVRAPAPESLLADARVQSTPRLAVDEWGDVFVAWTDASSPRRMARVWKFGSAGAPAPGWTSDGIRVSDSDSSNVISGLVPDGTGGVFAAWTEILPTGPIGQLPAEKTARLIRLGTTGSIAPGWPVNGLDMGQPDVPYRLAGEIAGDGAGGVFAQVCETALDGSSRVRVVRRGPGGELPVGYPAGGNVVTQEVFVSPHALTPDSFGGVYSLWGSGEPVSLQLLRVAGDGTNAPEWAGGPRTLVNDQINELRVVTDPAGVVHVLEHHADFAAGEPCSTSVHRITPGGTSVAGVTPRADHVLAFSAHPNPSTDAVELDFQLTRPGAVRLEVLDPAGRRRRTIASGGFGAGVHRAVWDGRDEAGQAVPAGLYFVVLQTEGARRVRRVAHLP